MIRGVDGRSRGSRTSNIGREEKLSDQRPVGISGKNSTRPSRVPAMCQFLGRGERRELLERWAVHEKKRVEGRTVPAGMGRGKTEAIRCERGRLKEEKKNSTVEFVFEKKVRGRCTRGVSSSRSAKGNQQKIKQISSERERETLRGLRKPERRGRKKKENCSIY